MAIIKTYPLKSNYYGLDRLLLSDMQPDAQGVVHGETKSLTLASLKSFIGGGGSSFTLETVGSSGPATLDVNTNILNIPDYSTGSVSGSGTAGRIPKWQDSNTLDDSEIFQSGTSIGIGTTTPLEKLDVVGKIKTTVGFVGVASSGYSYMELGGPSGGYIDLKSPSTDDYDLRILSTGSGGSFWTSSAAGVGTHVMTLNSSANVGIGTSLPSEKLEVTGKIRATGTADVLQLYRNSSSQSNYIKFYDNATSSSEFYLGFTSNNRDFQISNLASSGTVSLRSGGGSTMMLDSDQKVGIGTTAPAYKLDVNGDLRAKGITSSTTHTVTIEASAGWYRLMQWGGSSRGGATVKLSTTGGNVAPTTYVINAYKTYDTGSAPASTNTLKLEQYGNGGYISKARIATDSVTNVTYVEIYNAFTTANYTMEVYHDSLLGLDSLTSVLTGTLQAGPNSVSQDELPFVYEGTTTEKSSSELVTLIGDGTNDGKLRFNCSANSHYVEVVGPTHSGGSSYSLKLPNSLPSVSNQILEANALGVLSWIPTPSGGGSGGGTLNTVGLTMPSAFSVGNSPLTGTGGTISVTTTGGSAGEYLDYQGNWSTPAGTTPPVDSVSDGTSGASSGSALTVSPSTGAVKVTSNSYAGTTNVGHVPTGGSATTFLRGDGTWVTPPQGTITAVSGQSGISGAGTSGPVVLTNSDRGSTAVAALDFFKTIATPTNDVVASGNDDTLTLAAGSNTGIFVNGSGSQVTIGLYAPTNLALGGIKLSSSAATTDLTATYQTATAGTGINNRVYPVQLNSANEAGVYVPWTGGSGGGISFSGTTAGGLATYTNSTTAGVSSKVTLNASGLMDFDADGNSAGSIDYDANGTRLKIGDLSTGYSGIVEIFTNGNRQFQIGVNGEIGLGTGGAQGTSGQVLTSAGNGSPATWSSAGGNVPANNVTGAGNTYEIPMWNNQSGGSGSYIGAGNGFTSAPFKSDSNGRSIITTNILGGITFKNGSSAAAPVKIEGSTGSGGIYTIQLPQLIAASTSKVLGVSNISGSVMQTNWVDQPTIPTIEDGFIPLDIYQATLNIGGDDSDFSYIRQTQSHNNSTINKISFFVSSVGSGAEIRFALFDSANVKNSSGTCKVNAQSTSLTQGTINEMALTDGEGTNVSYTCTPGKNIVLFFAIKNCTIAGSAALSNSGIGYQSETYVTIPTVDDPLSTTVTAMGTDPNNKVAACHFYKS